MVIHTFKHTQPREHQKLIYGSNFLPDWHYHWNNIKTDTLITSSHWYFQSCEPEHDGEHKGIMKSCGSTATARRKMKHYVTFCWKRCCLLNYALTFKHKLPAFLSLPDNLLWGLQQMKCIIWREAIPLAGTYRIATKTQWAATQRGQKFTKCKWKKTFVKTLWAVMMLHRINSSKCHFGSKSNWMVKYECS